MFFIIVKDNPMKQPTYELKASELDYLSFDPSKASTDDKGTFTYVADLSNVDVEQLWTVGLNMDPTLFNFVKSVKVTVQHKVEPHFYGVGIDATTDCPDAPTASPADFAHSHPQDGIVLTKTFNSFQDGSCGKAEWRDSHGRRIPIQYICMSVGSLALQSLKCLRVDMALSDTSKLFETNMGIRLTYIDKLPVHTNGYRPISVEG